MFAFLAVINVCVAQTAVLSRIAISVFSCFCSVSCMIVPRNWHNNGEKKAI
eukprot:m.18013 g.18013  ORF g.18013 m.18013 type:complete len:51 (-) comp3634_c0_seq1:22-174(-)